MAIVRTVLGDVSPGELGVTLPHEHIFFHWPGAEADHAARYDRNQVLSEITVELRQARDAYGLSCVVDVSTSDAGRDIEFMADLSRNASVNIVAATGFYTESMGLPYYWRLRPLDALEEFFVREIIEGAVDSEIRCGIIKVASGPVLGTPLPGPEDEPRPSGGGLTAHEERSFRAAARAQKRLGVAITTHTDPYDWTLANIGARQLDILEEEGADPSRCIIGHAEGAADLRYLVEILKRGASVGIDSLAYEHHDGLPSNEKRSDMVAELVRMGYSSQVLLSYDRVFFEMRRPFTDTDPAVFNRPDLGMLFDEFIPGLIAAGVSEKAIEQITVDNPRRLLAF